MQQSRPIWTQQYGTRSLQLTPTGPSDVPQPISAALFCMLIYKHSFGGSITIEVDAELFGIGAKEDDAFTCEIVALDLSSRKL